MANEMTVQKTESLSNSEAFTNKVLKEFGSNVAGNIQVTDYQRQLIQGYFIATDRALKMAEEKRVSKNENNKDHKWDNTNYKRNKQLGTRVAESVDAARYRAQLIYEATVEEDRDKIWDNRDAWKNLNVLNGTDLVEVVLKSGEKDEILAKLDEISGYQPTMEDVAKN